MKNYKNFPTPLAHCAFCYRRPLLIGCCVGVIVMSINCIPKLFEFFWTVYCVNSCSDSKYAINNFAYGNWQLIFALILKWNFILAIIIIIVLSLVAIILNFWNIAHPFCLRESKHSLSPLLSVMFFHLRWPSFHLWDARYYCVLFVYY